MAPRLVPRVSARSAGDGGKVRVDPAATVSSAAARTLSLTPTAPAHAACGSSRSDMAGLEALWAELRRWDDEANGHHSRNLPSAAPFDRKLGRWRGDPLVLDPPAQPRCAGDEAGDRPESRRSGPLPGRPLPASDALLSGCASDAGDSRKESQ